jgi:hypothetical protein
MHSRSSCTRFVTDRRRVFWLNRVQTGGRPQAFLGLGYRTSSAQMDRYVSSLLKVHFLPPLLIDTSRVLGSQNGVRGSSHLRMTPANCTPCGTAVAATFDVDQVARLGGMLAREAKAKGVSLLLGPTCNISRHPGNGRVSHNPPLASTK